MFKQKYVD